LDIAVAWPNRIPFSGGTASGGDEQFVLNQRRDCLKTLKSLHLAT
jgi:hypothetical protein